MSSARERGLRPKERVIARLAGEGMSADEIAWRFRRSPAHIQRTQQLIELPGRSGDDRPAGGDDRPAGMSTPLERTILKARAGGASYPEIASRLRRSPHFVERVERLAGIRDQQDDR